MKYLLTHKTNQNPILQTASSVPSDSAFRIQGHYLPLFSCSLFSPFLFLSHSHSGCLSFILLLLFFFSETELMRASVPCSSFGRLTRCETERFMHVGAQMRGLRGKKRDRRDQMQEHDNAWNAAPWARNLMAERRLSLFEQPLRPRYGAQMVRER